MRPSRRALFRPIIAGSVAAAFLVVSSWTVVFAQWRNRPSSSALRLATPASFDGSFQFCRIEFRNAANGDGFGWDVDYPRADQNLSIRLSELTKTSVSFDDQKEPNHLLLRLDQPELFRCPFIMMTEVGGLYLGDDEAANLRNYLLKGGFLWADDFWGSYAWAVWESQIRKALPSGAHPIVDLPLDHPIFRQVLYFAPVAVFDASQLTNLEHKPLPLFFTALTDDQPELYRRLVQVVQEEGRSEEHTSELQSQR